MDTLADRARAVKVGDGIGPSTQLGRSTTSLSNNACRRWSTTPPTTGDGWSVDDGRAMARADDRRGRPQRRAHRRRRASSVRHCRSCAIETSTRRSRGQRRALRSRCMGVERSSQPGGPSGGAPRSRNGLCEQPRAELLRAFRSAGRRGVVSASRTEPLGCSPTPRSRSSTSRSSASERAYARHTR